MGDFPGVQVLAEYIVGDDDGLFFLEDDIFKTGDVDEFQVCLFLDSSGDASGVHFGSFLDFFGEGAYEDDIGDTEMTAWFQYSEYLLEHC